MGAQQGSEERKQEVLGRKGREEIGQDSRLGSREERGWKMLLLRGRMNGGGGRWGSTW